VTTGVPTVTTVTIDRTADAPEGTAAIVAEPLHPARLREALERPAHALRPIDQAVAHRLVEGGLIAACRAGLGRAERISETGLRQRGDELQVERLAVRRRRRLQGSDRPALLGDDPLELGDTGRQAAGTLHRMGLPGTSIRRFGGFTGRDGAEAGRRTASARSRPETINSATTASSGRPAAFAKF
jgi:hypothetical protein